MALGQVPYREFPLAHAPLTFLIQAALIRSGGRHYFIQIMYAAITGGLATVLAWRILVRILRGAEFCGPGTWLIALLLAVPLSVLGTYSVYPHPIYDSDCTVAILVAIYFLVRVAAPATPRPTVLAPLLAGAATVLPLFFKQNMGLPFLAVVAAAMLVLVAADLLQTRSVAATLRSKPVLILAGMAGALIVFVAAIGATAGLENYLHWTVQFAAQRRMPGLAAMLSVYDQPWLLWMLPAVAAGMILCRTHLIARVWLRMIALALIAAPFVANVIFLLANDDAEDRADAFLPLWPLLLMVAGLSALIELRRGITLARLIPFFLLAAIHGTLLSQQLWGSTYALWPLLMALVAFVLGTIPPIARHVGIGAAAAISAAFLICGGFYASSLERLGYVQIPEAPAQHSSTSALRGMATPGPFLSDLDELLEFAAREIPPGDAVLPLPGEDPFFYATGRVPQFPVTLFDPATDPYSAAALMEEARRRNVRWLIVKRDLQIKENPMPYGEQTLRLVQGDFELHTRLRGYDVYRRR